MTRTKSGAIGKILCPVDASPSSLRAVKLAAEMAVAFRAHLTVLHVAPILHLPDLSSAPGDGAVDGESQLVLEGAAKIAQQAGIEPSLAVHRGHAIDQILRHIASERPDIVVMGSRGLKGAKGLLLGSVSQAVFRRAKAPVVLVR